MLPNYPNYVNFHHKIILKPIILASVILNLCFINNYHDLSFNEFFIGIYAIFFVVLFSAINNEKVYWVYCVFSEKFILDKISDDMVKYRKLFSNKPLLFFVFFSAFLISIIILYFFSHLTLYLFSNNLNVSIIFVGGVIAPFLIWYYMRFIIHYYFYKAVMFLDEYSYDSTHATNFRLSNIVIKEIVISLIVNFSIVHPIRRKPAFLLDNSYIDIQFMIALIILLYSVLGVMLFLSRGSKINYFMGVILKYKINSNIENVRVKSLLIKVIILIIIVPMFSIIVCYTFHFFNFNGGFFLIYTVSLLPVLFFYYLERMARLYKDAILAFDMVLRLNALKTLEK